MGPGVILTDRVRSMLRDDDPVRVKTPLGPSEPDEVAPLALYLASDESRQMTGMILPLDGGASALLSQMPVQSWSSIPYRVNRNDR